MTNLTTASLLDPATLLAHQDFVRAIARRLLGDEHLVEDVVQDTWQAALTAGRGPQLGKLKSWLGTIAHNRALRELRTRDQRRKREERAAPAEALRATDEIVVELGASREIVDAVLALDEPYRSVVLHHHYAELPVAEIARRSSTAESTVASRLRKAHELLRTRLGGNDPRRHAAFVAGLRAVVERGVPREAALLAQTGVGFGPAGWAAALALFGLATLLAVAFLPRGDGDESALEARAPVGAAPHETLAATTTSRATERAEIERVETPALAPPPAEELDQREVESWRETTPAGVLAGIVKRGREPEPHGRVFARRGGSFATAQRPWHTGAPRAEQADVDDDEPVLSTTLDEHGRFRFEALASGNWAVGYEPSPNAPVFELWTSVDASEAGRSLVLVLGDASVSGTTFDDDGQRIDGALIALSSRNALGDSFHRFVWTRADGTYDLGDLPAGTYWWTGEPGGDPMYWYTLDHRTRALTLRPGEAAREDFGRDRPLPRVEGRLAHVDGAPVRGGGTLLVLPEQGGYTETPLAQDGSFAFRAEPGTYRVQLRHDGGDVWLDGEFAVHETDESVAWTLPGARLTGTLFRAGPGSARSAFARQPVQLERVDEGGERVRARATSDEHGRFEVIGLGAGTWRLSSSTLPGALTLPAELVVRASDAVLELDLEVQPRDE